MSDSHRGGTGPTKSFRLQLFLLVAVLIAGILLTTVLVAQSFQRMQSETVAVEERSGRILRSAQELQASFQQETRAWMELLLRTQEDIDTRAQFRDRFLQARQRSSDVLEGLLQELRGDSEFALAREQLAASYAAIDERFGPALGHVL